MCWCADWCAVDYVVRLTVCMTVLLTTLVCGCVDVLVGLCAVDSCVDVLIDMWCTIVLLVLVGRSRLRLSFRTLLV